VKPIINLDELKFVSDGPEAPGTHAVISDFIGAKKLGYNISVCPPGKSVCPFHNHRINEEMVFILEGEPRCALSDRRKFRDITTLNQRRKLD
jgi:uncharacterized cupin superfamily protein